MTDWLDRVRRVPPDRLLLWLLVAHVVLKVALFPRVLNAPLVGDEAQYVDGARALSNLWRDLGAWQHPDVAELDRSVVASGWFMPGMSAVLSPLFLVVPHADLWGVRLWTGVLTTLLLVATALVVRRTFGARTATAVVAVTGLAPMWVLFSYTAWGDLSAGLLAVVLLCLLVRWTRGYVAGSVPSWREGAALGGLLAAMLYLRSSTSPLVVGLLVLLGLGALGWLRGRARLRAAGALLLALGVVGALLAPWSWHASRTLDSRVVTTTSVATGLANTFGDRERLCYGPCDPGSTIWFAPVRYARETARATGRGEVEVLEQMSAHALEGVTPGGYATDVLGNLGRYAGYPAGYESWFRPGTVHEDPGDADAVSVLVTGPSLLLYYPVLVAGLVLLLSAVRRGVDLQVRVLAFKLVLGTLLLQPFVHIASTRYWPTFVPVLAVGALLLVEHRRSSAVVPGGAAAAAPSTLETWLWRAQRLLGVAAALVLVTLLVLSALHRLQA